jgi:NAD(P)-dependent dehydrogenase (short-subunit alcohol dehydrogenase family)
MGNYDLHGKSVLVTGASGGIGAATVRALVAKGARVTLVDLKQDAVDKVAATLPGDQVLAVAADVTSIDQMTAATAAAVERFGKLDVVFANAGIANDPPTTLASANLDAYERVIEVDLLGVVRTIKPALPQIIENKGYVLI